MEKYRHEYKYLISRTQAILLQSRLDVLMEKDSHTGKFGMYNIRSLYFDDYYNRCFNENENGTDPREKFRIRIYNGSCERISLECKRKERGKTLKKSEIISKEFVEELHGNDADRHILNTIASDKSGTLMKFKNLVYGNHFKPTVIVEYDRIPYIYRDGNVRVTFDFNLSSSDFTEMFLEGDYPKRPVMPCGQLLLEVKFDEFLPTFLHDAMQLDSLQQTAYSKYYLCRKYHI